MSAEAKKIKDMLRAGFVESVGPIGFAAFDIVKVALAG
jgi:hypothetical protein